MGDKTMEMTKDAGSDARRDAKRAEAEDSGGLRDEMATLAERIETLALDVARLGRGGLRDAAKAIEAKGERLAGDVGRELAAVENRAAATVRERPIQALGLALGLGALVALLLRR